MENDNALEEKYIGKVNSHLDMHLIIFHYTAYSALEIKRSHDTSQTTTFKTGRQVMQAKRLRIDPFNVSSLILKREKDTTLRRTGKLSLSFLSITYSITT